MGDRAELHQNVLRKKDVWVLIQELIPAIKMMIWSSEKILKMQVSFH